MKGLLIEFSMETGKRAGDINPRDGNLFCGGWQNLDTRPAKEIRVVIDDRDISEYEETSGVTVLHDNEEIEKAIIENIPIRYSLVDEVLFKLSIEEKAIKVTELKSKTREGMLEELLPQGVLGIVVRKPKKLVEVFPER